jgi:2-polyprenyl-3-methyl-5-hydroxy-6-metoxy-1,4-benzoquinol methylase
MKYSYPLMRELPGHSDRLRRVATAASHLHEKLRLLDVESLGLCDYSRRYLGKMLANPVGKLQRYGHLLALCLVGNEAPLERFVFVDYGGGVGMLSLLAKTLGIGRVVYNDIYDVSCEDAKKVALALGVPADDYVCGDLEDLLGYVRKEGILPNAVCSFDVIEHIYDIKGYLKSLPHLSHRPFRIVLASGANIRNPLVRRRGTRIHLQCEYNDREREWGHKDRDSLRSYLDTRKDMVRNYAPELDCQAVEEIARATRGLIRQDIERCVEEHKINGAISYRSSHPTNTCDPNTGNWAERLMRPEWLQGILQEAGFSAEIMCGYWHYYRSPVKRAAASALNFGIRIMGKKALSLSPYFIIDAHHPGELKPSKPT